MSNLPRSLYKSTQRTMHAQLLRRVHMGVHQGQPFRVPDVQDPVRFTPSPSTSAAANVQPLILFVHAISLLSFHHLTSPFTLHSASVSALSVNTRGFAESLTTRAKQQGRQPEEPAQKPCAFHHRRQREGSDHCGHFADCCRRRW